MARKCNLRKKIDRTIKRRASMKEREAHRKKIAESLRLAQENKERQKKAKQENSE